MVILIDEYVVLIDLFSVKTCSILPFCVVLLFIKTRSLLICYWNVITILELRCRIELAELCLDYHTRKYLFTLSN